jgi:hypothetical protein
MEGYAAGGEPAMAALEAAGDAVAAGLGRVMVRVACLFAAAAGAETLAAMEQDAVEASREIGLGALQLALDVQAAAEVPLPGRAGADGHWRGCREKSATTVVTMLGPVTVRRIACRSREKGVPDLHWRDAVLNLPPCGYSWRLQQLAEMACRAGSFQEAHDLVLAATGVSIGKRQLEEIVARAAADAEAFAAGRPVPDAPVIAGPDGAGRLAVLGMSADAKGVSVRPDALRADTARKAAKRERKGEKRLGSGQKQAKKRMAETGAVFDSLPPDGPARTPADIMLRPAGQPPRTPRAVSKWYTCGITAGCAEVIALVFAEADRRDPARERDWLALVDGNAHQISCFQAEAAKRDKDITILIDFIHVIEYLWKAALAFTPPGDTRATEGQVTAWGLDILAGNSRGVAAGIAAWPPRTLPGPAGSTTRTSARPRTTCRPRNPTWTTRRHSRTAGRSPPGSSRAPAGTSSATASASPEPAGACPAPRPCSGCAPSRPAATCPPTGTGTSPASTTATTSASSATRPHPRTPWNSPHDHHRELTLKEPHPCDIDPAWTGTMSHRPGPGQAPEPGARDS